MMTTYFKKCTTLEELKAEYKRLALMHHPDRGGDLETMKAINAEYDMCFPRLKDIHKTREGQTYTKATDEAPAFFRDLIDQLFRMDGIRIEVIGCFVWVSGNTRPHKDQLKALGFKWHSRKACWYLAPAGYHKKSRKAYSMEDIRDMFGVDYDETVDRQPNQQRRIS